MKIARKMFCAMIVVIALCAMLVMPAFAAETGYLWLNVTDAQQTNTTVVVCADTTVTNGMVELRYDSSKLTFQSVTVSEDYVSVHAVNTDTEGVVKIAWVAPGYYECDGTGMALITVLFEGVAAADEVTVSGTVYDAEGQLVEILSALDTSALEEAIAKAEALDKKVYTEESFAAVEEALEEAKAVLADDGATQAEVDAAAKKLNDAMAALVKNSDDSGDTDDGDTDDGNTDDGNTDDGNTDDGNTDDGDTDDSADTGDTIAPVAAMLLLSAAAMTVCLAGKKKGWWAK